MPFKDWKRPGDQPQEQNPGMQTPRGGLQQPEQQKQQPGATGQQNPEKKRRQHQPKQPGSS